MLFFSYFPGIGFFYFPIFQSRESAMIADSVDADAVDAGSAPRFTAAAIARAARRRGHGAAVTAPSDLV
jgi:hypothetical protein